MADVDLVAGLPPTVCCAQQNSGGSPRSTVGTLTEIHDFLRLLFARVGVVHCYSCGQPITQNTAAEIADSIEALPEGSRVMIAAPLSGDESLSVKIKTVRRSGLLRVQLDTAVYDIDQLPPGELEPESVLAIVDRIIVREDIRERVLKAIDAATEIGEGGVIVSHIDPQAMEADPAIKSDPSQWHQARHSTRYACPGCDIEFSEVSPRLFSFNSAEGACLDCEGLGLQLRFDETRLVDRSRSLSEGAIVPWRDLSDREQKSKIKELTSILAELEFDADQPLSNLEPERWRKFLDHHEKKTPGLFALLQRDLSTTEDDAWFEALSSFERELACESCDGSRLNEQANSVRVMGASLNELLLMNLQQVTDWFKNTASNFDGDDVKTEAATRIIQQITKRLDCLMGIGVSYLTLSRGANSLSGGELQRVRMCASLGSGLTGACFVLDEPSVGLHARDSERLHQTIRGLVDNGNSIVVVEHDIQLIQLADHVIDIGPGSGSQGGRIVAQGAPAEIATVPESPTGMALANKVSIATPTQRRPVDDNCARLEIVGATGFNLKNVNVSFPLNRLVGVSGVSGSGKSTLVNRTLAPAISDQLGFMGRRPEPFQKLIGTESIEKLIVVDQKPIGRNAKSCPATFTGLFDEIRKVFAKTRIAKQRGFGIGRFSFNAKAGRCGTCFGHGFEKVKLDFMPDAWMKCKSCAGSRFNPQTLQATFAGLSIADVLELTVDQARERFASFAKMMRTLDVLDSVGLGYLRLGQPASTLSGGESQRIKLAKELARSELSHTLYLLDEPTRGLHVQDIRNLLDVLQGLVDRGHSVIVIEHHLDMLKAADWLIDLGPEGGEAGGQVVATGTPEQIAECRDSLTGKYLGSLL